MSREGQTEASLCAPFSPVRWSSFPGSLDFPLVPTDLSAPLFLSSHYFQILSGCHPVFSSTFFQVHFCICFVQGSIIRECHISLPDSVVHSRMEGDWKGSQMPEGLPPVPQPLLLHRRGLLRGLFFLHCYPGLIKIASTCLVLTVY